MNMPLLDIQPRTLEFVVDLKELSTCVVQLTNTTHHFVAFKVKTTSPKKYCVRPTVGVVAPKSSCECSVIMEAFEEPTPDMVCKDKFLIQSTVVSAETTNEDIKSSMFFNGEGKHIEEDILRVTYAVQLQKPDAQNVNALDEYKLVKDNKEMKLKINALESKLKQADSTISKLMEERRQSLQQELVRSASSDWLRSCFFPNRVVKKYHPIQQ